MSILAILGIIISLAVLIFITPGFVASFKDPEDSGLGELIENAIIVDENSEFSKEEFEAYKKRVLTGVRICISVIFLIFAAILTVSIMALV